jgi:hypothetical protein
VFFTGSENDPPPGHVGIVVAPGTMIDAPHTGAVVSQVNYGTNGTGVNQLLGYRKVPGLAGSTANQSLLTGTSKKPGSTATISTMAAADVIVFMVALLIVITLVILGLLLAIRFAT